MSELTAALATIEKCREITGCPAGVDLQDHLRKLVAERDASLNAERIWEKTMMEVCGEDGPASVANEIRALRGLRDTALTALKDQVEQLTAENSALINSSVCVLQDGRPLHGFYASEWFIAKLKNGEYAALKALPEEYSYDYRTNDGTYYTKDWVVGWMQTPDTEYRPNVKTPATDRIVAGIKADGVEEFVEKCREKSKQAISSDIRDNWWLAGEHADDFAKQLRDGGK